MANLKDMINTTLTLIEQADKEFVEKGAALEHARWARWQNYLHSFLTWNDGVKGWVLPHEKKERWQGQLSTYYGLLSEEEKESDRKETRNYLPLTHQLLLSIAKEEVSRLKERMNKDEHPNTPLGNSIKLQTQSYNSAISDSLEHWKSVISYLEKK